MARDLKTVMNDSVFTAINGYDASTDKLMFNNFGTSSLMTRTTNNWMHDLVGSTGISPFNGKTTGGVYGARMGGALITPRHVIFARHYVLPVNNVIYFYDRNSVRHTRVITANAYHGMGSAAGDYYVAVLDSDLPSEIEPLKVFPFDLYKYFDPSQLTLSAYSGLEGRFAFSDDLPIIHTDQEEKSLIARATSIDVGTIGIAGFDEYPDTYDSGDLGKMQYGTPIDTDLQAWNEPLINGDSGTPHMGLIDDELILFGPTYTTSRVDSIVNLRTHNDINKLIGDADTAAGFNTGYKLTSYDLTGFKQYNIPGQEQTFIGDDISNGTLIQFRGSVTDHNDYHYSIPYAASSVVRTDPRDDTQTLYNITSISTSNQKWVGAAYASNKRIYAAPHAAYGPLIINTEDPANVTTDSINVGYGLQTRGIALNDNGSGSGAAYMTSYSGSESTKKFTYDAGGNESAVTSLNYTVPTDPYETARGSSLAAADKASFSFIYRSYWGAVNGGNDKIYGIPYGASQVQVIDLNDDSISFINTALTGNAEYDTTTSASTDYYYLRSPQWNKYKGGVLASNGCIYSHGTHARSVLKIDTSNDSVTEVPYPHTLVMAMTAGYTGAEESRSNSWGRQPASMFSVEGPDGKIYNTPWNLPYQIAIDPSDDSISFSPLSAILDEDSSGADLAWYTDGSLLNEQIFMAPGEADRILEIGFDGYTPAAFSTVTPYSQPASSPSPSPTGTGTPTPTGTPTQTPTSTEGSSSSTPLPTASNTGTPTPTLTPQPTFTATPSNSLAVSQTPTGTGTPTPTGTPSNTPTGTPTQTPTRTGTPTPTGTDPLITPSNTPSISNSQTATPPGTGTPTPTGTPTQTPSVTPSNNNNRCVRLEYDVEDGPDRFIVTYKDSVIIDTGFIGNAAYVYGGYKRQVFIDALVKEGIDFSGTTLADDGYPVVDTDTEGSKESIEALFNETDALVTIQSPVHDKPGWKYTLNCPMVCTSPTPTQTPTPTGTGTPTPTPTGTNNYVPPAVPSTTPTGTATSTPTPTGTPYPTPTYSPTQTPTQTQTSTPTPTGTPTLTPSGTPPVTITPTVQPTPTASGTPAASLLPPTPSFSLLTSSNNADEGTQVTVTIYTTHVANGTSVPYTITGIDEDDIHESLTGGFVINNNTGSISLSATEDLETEGPDILTITIDADGTSATVQINDTSLDVIPTPTMTPSNTATPAPTPNPTPQSTPQSTPQPSYALVTSANTINESQTAAITLYTSNIANGTQVPYTITGVELADISTPSSLTGNFTVNNGQASVLITTVNDFTTEGAQILTLTLDNVGNQATVQILDTSTDPVPSYVLIPFTNEIDEDGTLIVGLYTSNVADGANVPYTITGIESGDINESLTGNFTINNDEDTISITAVEDSTTEGTQVMTITLDGLSISSDVTLNDTSIDPTPTPTPNPTYSLTSTEDDFNEGASATITLTTTNVSDGINVPYTITGVDTNDINVALTGNFTISSDQDSITITAYEDLLTEGLEVLTLTLDSLGVSIDLDINDSSITPTPTPS